jgi:glyoxylase-like metal-dependent hydrolase (beta-lactamase superfamily II)
MRRFTLPALSLTAALVVAALPAQAASLQEAASALGVAGTKSIEFAGTGQWFQFGQAPSNKLPWPRFDVSRYVAAIDYDRASAKVSITRLQSDDAQWRRPAPTTQWANQYVSGQLAWNLPAAHLPQTPSAQPAAVEERRAEIWSTPHGFIKAALANNASSKAVKDGVEVSFSVDGKYRYVGHIDAHNQLTEVRTWIDTPVLGDTLVDTGFSDYQDFDGVRFPAHIVRQEGGHPVLDLKVASVKLNPALELAVPAAIEKAQPAAVKVVCTKLADGVFYLTGGTHHSVAIEQRDHVILVEAPLNEARSEALIAKLKEVTPGKPIKFLINTHAHFDHAGGLRTFVAQGATIVTHQANADFYKKVWAAPHSLNPDRLAQAPKAAKLDTFKAKHVLGDLHKVEIYPLAGSGHNDGFAAIYVPDAKVLIEADAFTPAAADAPLPASPNPYSVNLYDNLVKEKLEVDKIAALHGPRVTTLADLKAAIGK